MSKKASINLSNTSKFHGKVEMLIALATTESHSRSSMRSQYTVSFLRHHCLLHFLKNCLKTFAWHLAPWNIQYHVTFFKNWSYNEREKNKV